MECHHDNMKYIQEYVDYYLLLIESWYWKKKIWIWYI